VQVFFNQRDFGLFDDYRFITFPEYCSEVKKIVDGNAPYKFVLS